MKYLFALIILSVIVVKGFITTTGVPEAQHYPDVQPNPEYTTMDTTNTVDWRTKH